MEYHQLEVKYKNHINHNRISNLYIFGRTSTDHFFLIPTFVRTKIPIGYNSR